MTTRRDFLRTSALVSLGLLTGEAALDAFARLTHRRKSFVVKKPHGMLPTLRVYADGRREHDGRFLIHPAFAHAVAFPDVPNTHWIAIGATATHAVCAKVDLATWRRYNAQTGYVDVAFGPSTTGDDNHTMTVTPVPLFEYEGYPRLPSEYPV